MLPFNLGNVFQAQGRGAEAKVAWQIAVARDPAFAEAWYNLALAAEDEQQTDLAVAEYRRAVKAQPDYADAHFNLALLLTKLDRCDEALAAWQRFLELEPSSQQAATAQKAIALCRMKIQQDTRADGVATRFRRRRTDRPRLRAGFESQTNMEYNRKWRRSRPRQPSEITGWSAPIETDLRRCFIKAIREGQP